MKKILVPSNLTDVAEEGLKMAVKLAVKLNAEICLVNFFESRTAAKSFVIRNKFPAKPGLNDIEARIEMVRKNKSKLALLASHYAQQGVSIKYDIVNEPLDVGILPYIVEHEIDLVVIGIDVENTLEEKLTGTDTEQLGQSISCPVITVSTAKGIDLDVIVIALNKKSLNYLDIHQESLREMAEQLCTEAYVLCVINPTEKIEPEDIAKIKSFSDSLENTLTGGYKVVIDTDNENSVAEFSKHKGAGIISIFANVKNGFLGIVNNNFSQKILNKASIPVLNFDSDSK